MKLIISAILRTICPISLGILCGNTVKVFGPDITWRIIAIGLLAMGGTVGLMLSIQER